MLFLRLPKHKALKMGIKSTYVFQKTINNLNQPQLHWFTEKSKKTRKHKSRKILDTKTPKMTF